MNDFDKIFIQIKESFCALWSFKVRGSSLEVITPFSTTSNKFISVFLKISENQIVATDGGWLSNGAYDVSLDFDDELYMRIFNHYLGYYDISMIEKSSSHFFYKKTNRLDLVPNLVNDLSNFISGVASTSQVQFQDPKEKEERKMFSKDADSYIIGSIGKDRVVLRHELGEDYKSVKFNAIIKNGKKTSLVKYITGSSLNYFMSSMTKATVDFEIANHSPYSEFIDNRIALINDLADGYETQKIYRYLETLEDHTHMPSIKWSEKEKMLQLIN